MSIPLLLYLFNEAASGTGPTAVLDTSAGTAANATITYGTGSWTSIAAGDGLSFATGGSALTGSLGGTKVQTALAGSTTMTVQLVVDVNNTSGSYFTLYDTSLNPLIEIVIDFGNLEAQLSIANGGGAWTLGHLINFPSSGPFVATFVVDTNQSGGNKCLAWWGSTAADTIIVTDPSAGLAVDNGTSWTGGAGMKLGLGFWVGGAQTAGRMYFAALYQAALSSSAVLAGAAALLINNDANPNASSGASLAWFRT